MSCPDTAIEKHRPFSSFCHQIKRRTYQSSGAAFVRRDDEFACTTRLEACCVARAHRTAQPNG